jgi:hypothetical protein
MNRFIHVAILIALALCSAPAQGQMTTAEKLKALEEMKQRDAQSRADRIERRLAEANQEIQQLRDELAAATAALDQAKAETAQAHQRARELQDQLALYGAVPHDAGDPIVAGETPMVTARQIQITGERFAGMAVRLAGCTFATAHANYTSTVPGIEKQADGSYRIQRTNNADNWIGLIFTDANGNHFFHAYAPKDRYADLLLAMQRGTKIDITGVVVPTLMPGTEEGDPADRFALICETIEVGQSGE